MVLNTNFVKHFNNVTVEGLKNLIEKKVLVLPSSKYERLLVQSQTRVVYGKESGDVQVIYSLPDLPLSHLLALLLGTSNIHKLYW